MGEEDEEMRVVEAAMSRVWREDGAGESGGYSVEAEAGEGARRGGRGRCCISSHGKGRI